MALEEEFDTEIPDEEAEKITTGEYLKSKISAKLPLSMMLLLG